MQAIGPASDTLFGVTHRRSAVDVAWTQAGATPEDYLANDAYQLDSKKRVAASKIVKE